MASVRIILFNVKYSPNLGDGLLVECLERELATHFDAATIESLDLAGRTAYLPGRPERKFLLSVLQASPLVMRQTAAKAALVPLLSLKLQPIWRQRLASADVVVIGGGNLISDSDLNFPLKLSAAVACARECGVPVGVYGVGVSDNWTPPGARLFTEALAGTPLFHARVRDRRSAAIWTRRLPAPSGHPGVVFDPGLLASLHFPPPLRGVRARPLVGLGVMHPAALKYHSDQTHVSPTAQTEWMLGLVRACLHRGWSVRLFTNGSAEDEVYLKELAPKVVALGGSVEPRFGAPKALAAFISGLDLLYAHRLHANIAAYSYGVPHVGFSWDEKLTSFLSEVGRADCLAHGGQDSIEGVVDLGAAQMLDGLDLARRRVVLDRARMDVAQLASAIAALKPELVASGRAEYA